MSEDILFSMPNWCDSCETWHREHYWIYDDGKYSVCDDDGNHDDIAEEDLPSFAEQDNAWRDYSGWVISHGEDPLSEFYVKHSHKVRQRWQFRFSNSILGPILTEARRAGKRYWWNEVPEHVRQYLNLAPVTFNRGKLGDFATWDELIAAQPEIKQGVLWTVHIEHDEPRAPAVMARELRTAARKHLRQNPVKEAA